MAERSEEAHAKQGGEVIVVRRSRWGRIASYAALALLIFLLIVIAGLWIERRPIATHYLQREFERRGVTATYHLDRVGLRTQEVHDLVIGDPRHPDLTARHAILQTRLKWDGSFEVYRVYARGVRLRGRWTGRRISWGEVDKLLPPPSNKPFTLPNFSLDIADSSISLVTPFGPIGLALDGSGMLSGGFKGQAAIASIRLIPGRCAAENLHANVAVTVIARHPKMEGPVSLDRFICPLSRFDVAAPTFDAKASFNESFTSVDGSGRMAIDTLTAGANGLAAFVGDLTYKGPLTDVRGRVKLAAQKSRMATIYADRTRLDGAYRLGIRAGTFTMVGHFAADSSMLDPSMTASVTGPLEAAATTPIGPIAGNIAAAISRVTHNFNASGQIRVVNFPGGGGVRVTDADVIGPAGARARLFGGSGITYYWPANGLRTDGNIEMTGGGLPTGRVTLHQPGPRAPLSGVAQIAPYSVNGTRLALEPLRFGPGPGGATAVRTLVQLDGPFPNGRVQALRVPIEGRVGKAGSFALGTACEVVSFNYLQVSTLQLGPARLPVCPIGGAMISKQPGGPVLTRARIDNPVLNGRLGSSPLHLAASNGEYTGSQFAFNSMGLRLGKPESPIVFDTSRFTGRFAGHDMRGDFSGGKGSIGAVPILLSDASGTWLEHRGDFTVNGQAMVSDRAPDPRFYPLKTNDLHLTIAGDTVRATGSLHQPDTGILVTNVGIEHHIAADAGQATLDVPGITFGPTFQPDQLTRLTEGVVALVNGTIRGQGRIDWAAGGKVTSTGDFSTANMDLAAPFGPVTGLSTSMHFTDLLKLETAPHQVATVQSINPGIIVNDGVITYQILPNNLVKVERGEWPFMGGKLILHETVLNFGSPSAKRLTFELQDFDARQFIDSLGFSGFMITGTFDGVLPMIFDENGGRIVGGRLDSRPPGGEFIYSGTRPKGMAAGVAFDLLSDLHYRSMIIRLNGDLAGEFATNLAIDGVSLGPSHGFVSGLVHRAFSKLPLKLNVNINAPFRALIQMAKAFKDPTQVIAPVMPFPIDSPALKVEVQNMTKQEEQTSPPAAQPQPVTPSPPPGGTK